MVPGSLSSLFAHRTPHFSAFLSPGVYLSHARELRFLMLRKGPSTDRTSRANVTILMVQLLVFFILLAPADCRSEFVAETVAGLNIDNGPAAPARLNFPSGIALDLQGNIYFSDTENNRIRRVDADGNVSTLAGTGRRGYSGDGGNAIAASLDGPIGVAVDQSGNVFFADSNNHVIREITTDGIIHTIAGGGETSSRVNGIPALKASLSFPWGVALDSYGNVYFSEKGNHVIRMVHADGKISTAAGTGIMGYDGDGGSATKAAFSSPAGICIDSMNRLIIADAGNQLIRRIDEFGNIQSIAGTGTPGFSGDGGQARAAMLQNPHGLTTGASGNIYIADTHNQRIRKIDAAGQITTIAGTGYSGQAAANGPALAIRLQSPAAAAVAPSGEVYIADTSGNRIRKLDTQGQISTVAGTGSSASPPSSTLLKAPGAVTAASQMLYIADRGDHRVLKVNLRGSSSVVAGNGQAGFSGDGGMGRLAGLSYPSQVAVDPTSADVYVADSGNHRIRRIDSTGMISTFAGNGNPGFSGDGDSAVHAALNTPEGIAIDPAGRLIIADTYNNRIRAVGIDGRIMTIAGNGSAGFSGDGGGAQLAELNLPRGVDVDTSGNIFIADSFNNRIRKIGNDGMIDTIAGSGTTGFSGDGGPAQAAALNCPHYVKAAPTGEIYIADTFNYRVRRVDGTGSIMTVAGNGVPGFSGDGGLATAASIGAPRGLAIGTEGAIYLADAENGRIRRFHEGTVEVATLRTVCAQGCNTTSIQTAIELSRNGDSVLVGPGVYTGRVDFQGKTLTIESTDGPDVTTLDGAGRGSVVTIANSEGPNAVLSGFTIRNGFATYGGGITIENASPIIRSCVITQNSASTGGGISVRGASRPVLQNLFLTDNRATDAGGGMAITAGAVPAINRNQITANTAGAYGGGIYVESSSPEISQCTISGNSARLGGGLAAIEKSPPKGSTAVRFQPIVSLTNPAKVINSLVVSNAAGLNGGALYVSNTFLQLLNATLSDNFAPHCGGLFVDGKSAVATVHNSIIWKNGEEIAASLARLNVTYSDVRQNSGVFIGEGNINADPRFSADYHLQPGSPCIDKGSRSGAPSIDIEDKKRPMGAGIDIGAEEVPPGRPAAFTQAVKVLQGTLANIALSGRDPNAAPLSYILKSQPGNGSLTGTAPNLTYSPKPGFSGSDVFTFIATNGYSSSNIATVNITVNKNNHPPVAKNAFLQTKENVQAAGRLEASDPDGGTLIYSIYLNGTKGNVTITNASTGAFTYVPNKGAYGKDSFSFRVSDGINQCVIPGIVMVDIAHIDKTPTISLIPPVTIIESHSGRASFKISDPDNPVRTLSLSAHSSDPALIPNGNIVFSGSGANRTATITPSQKRTGSAVVTISAGDGEASASTKFTVVVVPGKTATAATPPSLRTGRETGELIADAGPEQVVSGAETVTLSAANSFARRGRITSYRWNQVKGTAVELSDAASVRPCFAAPQVVPDGESLVFELTVIDSSGVERKDRTIVNVTDTNFPPSADAGMDQNIAGGQEFVLDGSRSSAPHGRILTYQWEQITGPEVKLSNPSEACPTFTAPEPGSEGVSLVFQLTVSDAGSLLSTDRCTVNVIETKLPPIAVPVPDQVTKRGSLVTLDGQVSTDSGNGDLEYRWSQRKGPPVDLSDPSAARTTFVAPGVGAEGVTLVFELTVKEPGGMQSGNTCSVQIAK